MLRPPRFLFVLALLGFSALRAADAPYIDANAVRERWETVTPADIAELRGANIIVGSKSIGLNLVSGLALVGKDDPAFNLVQGFARFDVEKNGGVSAIPSDVFQKTRFVHFMATRHPYAKRMQELDTLMREKPWSFGGQTRFATIIYAEVDPAMFPAYRDIVAGLRRDYPGLRFVHSTTSVYTAASPLYTRSKDRMHAFNELLRAEYKGKEPIFDLEAILSDDGRDGVAMLPEYTKDPTGVHPSLPPGMRAMGRGFILTLRDSLRWSPAPVAGSAQNAAAPVALPTLETVAPDHPEYRAVRAILNKNGQRSATVEGRIQVRDGHVVGLFIQESGITVIPDEIGQLTKLERLSCYGDRELSHPYLTSISPEIGKCVALRELLLTHNDLTTLPAEIASLPKLETLSLADNRLRDLPPAVAAWAARLDPQGIAAQAKP